jgi:FtsX-like permease family
VIAVVSAVSFIRTFEVHALRRRFAWVPWELLAIAAGVWVLFRLRGGGALVEDTRLDIQRPSALLLLFPVLFVAGFATLLARLMMAGLRRAAPRIGESSPVLHLAVHRLTGLPGLTIMLIGATALCLGVFVNGQTLVRSLRTTVDAKAGVFVGSDVQVQIDYEAPPQERFPFPITRATRLKYAGRMQPGDIPFDILGIDASTIADAAYWADAFADGSLDDMVSRLRSDEGPLRAILVQGGGDPSTIQTAQVELPIDVVGRAIAFPGVSSDDPVIVVDVASLTARVGAQGNPLLSPNARTEYWIAGDPADVLPAVGELEAYPLGTLTAEDVKDVPFIKAAIETFSMLNLLGLAAALLVVGVLVVYLQARQRARMVSNVLSMRMGMSDAQAMGALILELAAVVLVSFLLGAALGVLAGALVSPLLDPLQTIPPPPLFTAPVAVLAWTAVALVAVAALGGWAVHRRAARVDLGEVLRVAG